MEEEKSGILQHLEKIKAGVEIVRIVAGAYGDGEKAAEEIQRALDAKAASGYEHVVTNPSSSSPEEIQDREQEALRDKLEKIKEGAEAIDNVEDKAKEHKEKIDKEIKQGIESENFESRQKEEHGKPPTDDRDNSGQIDDKGQGPLDNLPPKGYLSEQFNNASGSPSPPGGIEDKGQDLPDKTPPQGQSMPTPEVPNENVNAVSNSSIQNYVSEQQDAQDYKSEQSSTESQTVDYSNSEDEQQKR